MSNRDTVLEQNVTMMLTNSLPRDSPPCRAGSALLACAWPKARLCRAALSDSTTPCTAL